MTAVANKWSLFRPCIDLHGGQVKQIVGGTLTTNDNTLATNFVASEGPAYYASLYKADALTGAHVIMLGPGNEDAAREALKAWPNGLQVGGGINAQNAQKWLDAGAEKLIITSWLFPDGEFSMSRLQEISKLIGTDSLVLDLSCRRRGNQWFVATNKWQTITSMELNAETLRTLSEYCCEFLIHAADVEGLCKGIDEELVERLGEWTDLPCTYAGGGRTLDDLHLVHKLSRGKVDLTFGSALDIFGGTGVKFADCVAYNKEHGK
ncbi:1-(5-phosphoribosyl)-5-[(5-phosphoribosylamino)methylideneamino] imidazole-4-carboxamide isomerase [Sphaeroforma arctica JP610]|uniref:1-(5-phosphoribosyl)-5-[(5-phosphoribosylamino)methylideneamino]imidazole-4-carboxamideisomerase n=1 Tax=Sphaeroforma arctica JP610 TaxID=667725 RepID=A0A0L0G2U2_9EUKA|nr:1-(5-phosphoribosyl)-5-[(5-phosphoribosylamino)methylideneamino] imidazole-4-carboxamide isomerase [Sphaeroforma arctica JP610]KNC83452.1 1-(5-phosphoribosyl)-5-[(5-phosphoribosylamino)methylideneamino] imidazole-4-carboxamide isomerase [Sphaeroforma arctica JP610]|eukprot:XP_014157354.1 1-(5-phosphoribosyl)-5-[(5-phosphoribosylamino)methylideneamino] imidazole-4-carboxamide isomerase [Sphaeroforma arctica JP610]